MIYIKRFCLCLFIFQLFNCTGGRKKEADESPQVFPITSVLSRDTTISSEYITEVHAVKNIEIRARVSGFLDQIFVDEGQEVKKGQPLFNINDEEYKAELAKAQAFLNSAIAEATAAKVEVAKVRMLVEKNVVAHTELEVAEAKLIAANSKIEEAKSAASNASIKLSYAHIKAPFNGIINRIPLKPGSLIEEGSLLTTLSDNSEVYTYFNVSENEYLNLLKSKGTPLRKMKIQLLLADGSRYNHNGVIETMEGEFDPNTGSIAFRAKFPNPERLLKHGSSGKIIISNSLKGALILPQRCVFEIQDKNYVYVIDSTNRVKVRSFVPMSRIANMYIIKSGLKEGDQIIYEGIQDVSEGELIIPKVYKADSLLRQSVKKI